MSLNFILKGGKTYDLNKENIKKAFNEDIEDIKRGRSTTTYYIEDQGKLKLRNETTPNNVNTAQRVMEIATGHGNRVYENPLQFAIAVKGFEDWCIDRNVAPCSVLAPINNLFEMVSTSL